MSRRRTGEDTGAAMARRRYGKGSGARACPRSRRRPEEGLREGLLEAIELGLKLKFGSAGLALLPEIDSLTDVNVLCILQRGVRRLVNLEDLQRIYRPYLGNPPVN